VCLALGSKTGGADVLAHACAESPQPPASPGLIERPDASLDGVMRRLDLLEALVQDCRAELQRARLDREEQRRHDREHTLRYAGLPCGVLVPSK